MEVDIINTSEGCHDSCGEYHEYIRGCSVHRRDIMIYMGDIMSTLGVVQYLLISKGYHEYIGRCPVHQRDVMSILRDLMFHVCVLGGGGSSRYYNK